MNSETTETLLEVAHRYLRALEAGATDMALATFFTPDVVQQELPNRLVPAGATRDLAALLEAAERGQQVIAAQHYDVLSALAGGTRVVMEVAWRGTLKVALGSLPEGGEMRAQFAVFLDFRGDKIAAQRNYDCFDPW